MDTDPGSSQRLYSLAVVEFFCLCCGATRVDRFVPSLSVLLAAILAWNAALGMVVVAA